MKYPLVVILHYLREKGNPYVKISYIYVLPVETPNPFVKKTLKVTVKNSYALENLPKICVKLVFVLEETQKKSSTLTFDFYKDKNHWRFAVPDSMFTPELELEVLFDGLGVMGSKGVCCALGRFLGAWIDTVTDIRAFWEIGTVDGKLMYCGTPTLSPCKATFMYLTLSVHFPGDLNYSFSRLSSHRFSNHRLNNGCLKRLLHLVVAREEQLKRKKKPSFFN